MHRFKKPRISHRSTLRPVFSIDKEHTETFEDHTIKEAIWFDSEVEDSQRLMSLYAECCEYDYTTEVIDWLAPYARDLDEVQEEGYTEQLETF